MSVRGHMTQYHVYFDKLMDAMDLHHAIWGRLNANRFDGFPPLALQCVSVLVAPATGGGTDLVFAVVRASAVIRGVPAQSVLGVSSFPERARVVDPHAKH